MRNDNERHDAAWPPARHANATLDGLTLLPLLLMGSVLVSAALHALGVLRLSA